MIREGDPIFPTITVPVAIPKRVGNGGWIRACAEPRAIVIGEGGRWRALDLNGARIELEPLLEQVAGLSDVVG